MEETTRYEDEFSGLPYRDYFSDEEWESLQIGGWVATEAEDQGRVQRAPRSHRVSVAYPPGLYEGNEDCYEIECDVCDYIGAAESAEEAQAIARLHEAFVATLAENGDIDPRSHPSKGVAS